VHVIKCLAAGALDAITFNTTEYYVEDGLVGTVQWPRGRREVIDLYPVSSSLVADVTDEAVLVDE
jgi:hypothetical protein